MIGIPSLRGCFRKFTVKHNHFSHAWKSAQEIAMLLVAVTALLLIGMSTAIHYESLSALFRWLPSCRIPCRSKLLVVIFGAFIAHALEIAVYGLTF